MSDEWDTSPTSKPKKKLTRKKKIDKNIRSPPLVTERISFYLSPGEHVLKVLCHWNHIGELLNNPMWDSRCIDCI